MPDRLEEDKACRYLWRKKKDEGSLDRLIDRYETKVFVFVLYLSGCDLNAAYEVTAESFVSALAGPGSSSREGFSVRLFTAALEKSRYLKSVRFFDASKFVKTTPVREKLLHTSKKALEEMSFDDRVIVLLRDQVNLTYEEIGRIRGVSLQKAKVLTGQARNQFRKTIDRLLER